MSLLVAVGCAGPSAMLPTAPSPLAVIAGGLPLTWEPAANCSPMFPLPAVVGTEPQRVLENDGGLRGFWPVSDVRTIAPNHTAQDFIVADFLRTENRWALCAWAPATREEIRCTVEDCA